MYSVTSLHDAADNLALFEDSVSDEQISSVLETLGLENWLRELPAGLDTQLLEALLDVLDLMLRLLEMLLQRLLYLRILDLACELRQHLRNSLLGIVHIAQFVDEQVLCRLHSHITIVLLLVLPRC